MTLSIKGFDLCYQACCIEPEQRQLREEDRKWFRAGRAFTQYSSPSTLPSVLGIHHRLVEAIISATPSASWMLLAIGIITSWSVHTKHREYKQTEELSSLKILDVFFSDL